ncbi:hypothetical protein NQ318_021734 [Aromia moschata]|uniref:Uncharacterized protein n=1 Tax=Aromia moschata TaxID=1265417 RepID=A0AAV8XZ76_9CUCU|nr:hypothetical protein NQ318_021734 [Aromia moschata]
MADMKITSQEKKGQGLLNNICFQQDETHPYYVRIVRDRLNQDFTDGLDEEIGEIDWPTLFPDLNSLDYFLCGYLKSQVDFQRPNRLSQLAQRITGNSKNYTGNNIEDIKYVGSLKSALQRVAENTNITLQYKCINKKLKNKFTTNLFVSNQWALGRSRLSSYLAPDWRPFLTQRLTIYLA